MSREKERFNILTDVGKPVMKRKIDFSVENVIEAKC